MSLNDLSFALTVLPKKTLLFTNLFLASDTLENLKPSTDSLMVAAASQTLKFAMSSVKKENFFLLRGPGALNCATEGFGGPRSHRGRSTARAVFLKESKNNPREREKEVEIVKLEYVLLPYMCVACFDLLLRTGT